MESFRLGGPTDATALQKYLTMLPPTSPDKAPAILSFTRPRALRIDWNAILTSADQHTLRTDGITDDPHTLRNYFERRWKRRGLVDVPGTFPMQSGHAWGTGAIQCKLPNDSEPAQHNVSIYLIDSNTQDASRMYVPLTSSAVPVAFNPATENYDLLWQRTASVVLARTVGETDVFPSTDAITVSREAQLLRTEFERLDTLHELAKRMRSFATKPDTLDSSVALWWKDPSQLPAGQKQYMEFASWGSIVRQKLDALAERAKALGYFLALEKTDVPLPNGKPPLQLEKGELYRPYNAVINWTTPHTRYRTTIRYGSCGSVQVIRTPIVEYDHHSASVVLYEKVLFSIDPVQAQIDKYVALRYSVHQVSKTEVGYVSTTGEALRDIMLRCENDEEYRRNCVVVVRENRSLFSGELYDTGAFFFLRPMSAFGPTQFPAVSMSEDLSYTIQWTGTELGPLVRTICLGPGEERTVAISNSYQQQVTDTRSVRSTSDVSMSNSEDFASEVENEAQEEFSQSRSSSTSVSGGFGIGPFSASASASSTSASSLRNFAKSVNKVARKAARSFSRKVTTDVSSSRTSVTTVTSSESTSFSVKNINDGRTLNLIFHQINNRFNGGLYLDDLRIEVTDGAELIAGSGLHDVYMYELFELDKVMFHLRPEALPIDVKVGSPSTDPDRFIKYWNTLLDHLIDILQKEYRSRSRAETDPELTSCSLIQLQPTEEVMLKHMAQLNPPPTRLAALKQLQDALPLHEWPLLGMPPTLEDLGKKFEELKAILQSKVVTAEPLMPDELIVASGGLYVDAAVGAMTAVEPYSDGMRDMERARRAAEVEKDLALASESRARAAALYWGVHNCIVSITPLGHDRQIELSLRRQLPEGKWKVMYDGAMIHATLTPSDKLVTIQWPVVMAVPDLPNLKKRLALVDSLTLERLMYLDLSAIGLL